MKFQEVLIEPLTFQEASRKYQFNKGHIPANKGKKMRPEVRQKVEHTFFKSGHLPHNTKSDGVITIRKDKKGIPQQFIRIGLANWMTLKQYIFEAHFGKIQKGEVIRFIDGNTLNCKIENLKKITKAENLRLNILISGVGQRSAHVAHNHEVAGSNPASATT